MSVTDEETGAVQHMWQTTGLVDEELYNAAVTMRETEEETTEEEIEEEGLVEFD